jgi:hypothetical protein
VHSRSGGEERWTLDLRHAKKIEASLESRRADSNRLPLLIATLSRLGVRWERAKRWIESPDPEYARKKGLATG